eukprot:CAMPEP_0117549604 /NCGR_PEP_ID=MMETSP0784-20121206/48251_1 /TAXON_ID=39447 /ORGANISM="" /LENGTH=47 /DNA_ID= /DNA_START= /DNA_END= /DNA_ORIENTATION=
MGLSGCKHLVFAPGADTNSPAYDAIAIAGVRSSTSLPAAATSLISFI